MYPCFKKCFNVKSSTYYFHMKTKILADFQICISLPLIEDSEVISSDNETADVLNTFCSSIVNNLNFPEYPISNPYYSKIRDPVLKAIVKYKDHPSIKAIGRVPKPKNLINFSNVEKRIFFKKLLV